MIQFLHPFLYTFIAIILLTSVGNIACRILFAATGLKTNTPDEASTNQRAGWIIGWLERLVLAIGILTFSWEVLAAVIALKTVARFKELDDRGFAEIFLVGSLFSILWAVVISYSWLGYDRYFGADVHSKISTIYAEQSQGFDDDSDDRETRKQCTYFHFRRQICYPPSELDLYAPTQ